MTMDVNAECQTDDGKKNKTNYIWFSFSKLSKNTARRKQINFLLANRNKSARAREIKKTANLAVQMKHSRLAKLVAGGMLAVPFC